MIKNEKEASSKLIFKHLYDQMISLKTKDVSVEEAKAQANLAKQANNTLRYELDRAIASAKYGDKLIINEIDRS